MPNNNSGLNIASFDPTLIAKDDGNTNKSDNGNAVGDLSHNNDGNAIGNLSHDGDGNTSVSGTDAGGATNGNDDGAYKSLVDDGNTSNQGTLAGATGSLDGNATALGGSAYDKAANDGNSGNAGALLSDDGNTLHSYNGDTANFGPLAGASDFGNTLHSYNGDTADSYNTITPTLDSYNTTSVDIGVDLKDAFGSNFNNSDGATLVMPEDISQSVGGHGGVDTLIAMDQVNSLVSNNTANNDYVENYDNHSGNQSLFSGDHVLGGDASADGNTGTSALSATAGAAASIDAFTQSIVLGANIQYNNFSVATAGHDMSTTDSVGLGSGGHH